VPCSIFNLLFKEKKMDYTLNLTIKESDLRTIKTAGLKITVAKPVGGSKPNVAWLTIDPFEAVSIQWSEEYGLYASTTQKLDTGTVISKFSELPPPQLDGKSYLFGVNDSNVFDRNDAESCPQGSFHIGNQTSAGAYPLLTFGLTQKAIIQGTAIRPTCLNAAPVMAKMDVLFTPLTMVYVWLQNSYTSGTIITDITSKSTRVEFGAGTTEQGLIFDPSKGQFEPAAAVSGNKVTLLAPAGLY
jgi:hypothetical protein